VVVVVVASVLAVLIGSGVVGSRLWQLEQERRAAEAARIEQERQVALASDTVRGFFDALARADVAAALSYGTKKVESEPLLNTEVVRQAVAAAPVTELVVEVGEFGRNATGGLTTAAVTASYRIGGEPVERSWTLVRRGEVWRFEKVTTTVDLSGGGVITKLNGLAPNRAVVEVLPGKYALTTDDKIFSMKAAYVAKGPGESAKWLPSVKVRPEALQAAAKAVTASYKACVAKKNISDLSGCPFAFEDPTHDGYTIVKDGFQVVSKGNPFASPKLVKVSETEYTVTETITIGAMAVARKGGSVYTLTWEVETHQAVATLILGSPDVQWNW